MKKTRRDIEKAGTASFKWVKTGIYYIFIPIVVAVGLKTVSFGKPELPIWSICAFLIKYIYLSHNKMWHAGHLNLIKMEVILSHPRPAIVSLAISSSNNF